MTASASGAVTPGICGTPLLKDRDGEPVPAVAILDLSDVRREDIQCDYCRAAAAGQYAPRLVASARMLGVEPWHLNPQTWAVELHADQERGELVNVTWLDGERRHPLSAAETEELGLAAR